MIKMLSSKKVFAGIVVGGALGLAMVPLAGPVFADFKKETTTVNVNVGGTITLTMSGSNPTNISAIPGGAAGTATQTATVSTNNATGYNLTLSMSGTDQKLNNGSVGFISPISATGALGGDEWGYNTDAGTNFSAVPVLASPVNIKTANGPVTNESTVVTYGAKVTSALPSGEYKNTVVYTATTK